MKYYKILLIILLTIFIDISIINSSDQSKEIFLKDQYIKYYNILYNKNTTFKPSPTSIIDIHIENIYYPMKDTHTNDDIYILYNRERELNNSIDFKNEENINLDRISPFSSSFYSPQEALNEKTKSNNIDINDLDIQSRNRDLDQNNKSTENTLRMYISTSGDLNCILYNHEKLSNKELLKNYIDTNGKYIEMTTETLKMCADKVVEIIKKSPFSYKLFAIKKSLEPHPAYLFIYFAYINNIEIEDCGMEIKLSTLDGTVLEFAHWIYNKKKFENTDLIERVSIDDALNISNVFIEEKYFEELYINNRFKHYVKEYKDLCWFELSFVPDIASLSITYPLGNKENIVNLSDIDINNPTLAYKIYYNVNETIHLPSKYYKLNNYMCLLIDSKKADVIGIEVQTENIYENISSMRDNIIYKSCDYDYKWNLNNKLYSYYHMSDE